MIFSGSAAPVLAAPPGPRTTTARGRPRTPGRQGDAGLGPRGEQLYQWDVVTKVQLQMSAPRTRRSTPGTTRSSPPCRTPRRTPRSPTWDSVGVRTNIRVYTSPVRVTPVLDENIHPFNICIWKCDFRDGRSYTVCYGLTFWSRSDLRSILKFDLV